MSFSSLFQRFEKIIVKALVKVDLFPVHKGTAFLLLSVSLLDPG